MPINGRHSTIERPLPVNRVMPPITTMMATKAAIIKSHQTTAGWLRDGDSLEEGTVAVDEVIALTFVRVFASALI